MERIAFIRGFKKGKGFLIYAISIPLYVVGYIYAGNEFLASFFASVNKVINTVVLKYETSVISNLMTDNLFYKVSVYICCADICLCFAIPSLLV